MDIGAAMTLVRAGHHVARAGWNGKGMFVYHVKSGSAFVPSFQDGADNIPTREFILMKTVDGSVVPWVAAQTDILADDWTIVEAVATQETGPVSEKITGGIVKVGNAPN